MKSERKTSTGPTIVRPNSKDGKFPASRADTGDAIGLVALTDKIGLSVPATSRRRRKGAVSVPRASTHAATTNPSGIQQRARRSGRYAKKRLVEAERPPAYDALREGCIRLVQIGQDALTGFVECRTKHFPLQAPPPYTALSYACGARPANFNIKLNGMDWYIRQNLSRFLRQHVQIYPASQEWMWIDAICINQENLPERTHQVKLMAAIYSKAFRVLVWLGPAFDDSNIVMRGPLQDCDMEETITAVPWLFAFESLCARKYWQRLWVVQELRLAKEKNVMCGSTMISWHHLTEMMSPVDDYAYGPTIGQTTSAVASRYKLRRQYEWHRQYLMDGTHDSAKGCSDNHRTLEPSNRVTCKSICDSLAFRMIGLVSGPMWALPEDLLDMFAHLQCEDTMDKAPAIFALATFEVDSINYNYSEKTLILLNDVLKSETGYDHSRHDEPLREMFGIGPGRLYPEYLVYRIRPLLRLPWDIKEWASMRASISSTMRVRYAMQHDPARVHQLAQLIRVILPGSRSCVRAFCVLALVIASGAVFALRPLFSVDLFFLCIYPFIYYSWTFACDFARTTQRLDQLSGKSPLCDPFPGYILLTLIGAENNWVLNIPLHHAAEEVSLSSRVRWGGCWGLTYMFQVNSREWRD